MYFKQSDLQIDKYWNELLQVLTEDENLRVRMGDVNELKKTDAVEFYTHVKYFEDRIEAQMKKIKNANKNG